MKKMFRGALAVAALGVVAALSACSTSSSNPGGGASPGATLPPATITFQTFETPSLTAAFWDSSIQRGAAQVPGLTVKKVVATGDRTAFVKQLQGTGQFPDVTSSIVTNDFVKAGLLQPFDQQWLNDNFILPNANAIGGKTYTPPTNAQILPMVYYNKSIFEKQGIQIPKTYADLVNVVKTLKAAGVTPFEFGGKDPWAASMPIVALASVDVLGKDPNWVQSRYNKQVSFSDANFKAAMQKQQDLIAMGAYSPTALSTDYATANKEFLNGQAAMYVMGSWFTGSGYLTPAQAAGIGAFPWPSDDGSVILPVNVGGTTSVSAKSPNEAQAMAFAKAWSADPQNLKLLIETDGAFPMSKTKKLADYGATVTDLYTSTFAWLSNSNYRTVDAFSWVVNGNALASGMNDKFYAFAQSQFTSTDLAGGLAALDTAWAAAGS